MHLQHEKKSCTSNGQKNIIPPLPHAIIFVMVLP